MKYRKQNIQVMSKQSLSSLINAVRKNRLEAFVDRKKMVLAGEIIRTAKRGKTKVDFRLSGDTYVGDKDLPKIADQLIAFVGSQGFKATRREEKYLKGTIFIEFSIL
jgi:hypothetical protein